MLITKKDKQLFKIAGGINLLFLLLSIAFVLFFGSGDIGQGQVTKKVVAFVLANSACWLVNLLILTFLVPLASKWKYPRWLSFYLLSYLITFSLAILIGNSHFYNALSDEHPGEPLRAPIAGPIFFVISINTLSLLAIELVLSRYAQIRIRIENANMRMENAELKMKSLEAQHEKLKSQLHPHFLFNSLNALNSLIKRDPGLAENYLIKLSDFLRFSISHNEQNVVPLKEELKFSLYYLEMQKIRFQNALSYNVNIPPEQQINTRIPVFSLQLILENAIKHNKFTYEQPLCISMRIVEPDWLLVENNVHEKLTTTPGSGRGLKNLSERYMLLIQENIKVSNDHDFFRVYLKLIRE
ncbi:MAG: histidine kinase [Chitinophagaceae bacterium]|nr:histidine kinase [Chitinophagaceae bacterium]